MTGSETSSAGPVVTPEQALEFMAGASALLARSLDYETTLREVARLAVPEVADWCGVLLADLGDGERELSSGYSDPALEAALLEIRAKRREEEGASESRRVAQTGEPILATDVRATIDETIEDHQRELIERLAPKSYLIVPLAARGRVLGSMTLLSTRAGRHYTESDLAFAVALAERCALAIDNARLHDRAERSLSLLDTVFSTAPVGLALVDRDLRFVRVNETFAAFNARPVGELVGRTVPELLRAAGLDEETVIPSYGQVLDSGGRVLDLELTTHSRDGTARHWNASFTPVTHADGSVTGVIVSVIDVTERRALLESEREARVRADFLAHAGAILDASLDYEETLRSVVQIAIPEVADWCAVSVLDDAGVLQEVATAHVDEGQREIGAEISRRFPADPSADSGSYRVARSGETAYVREVTDEMLAAGIPDPEHLDLVRRLGLRSVIIAALKARGRVFGTFSLASAESGRLFEQVDVQLAEELAARAGMAIDNARLYTERSRIAHTLQVKLLPERLPRDPARAHGRPLSRRRRAQRGRRRLLRRLPALADRVGARGRRRVGQGGRGRRHHRAGPLHAARRRARGHPAQRRPAASEHRDALRRHVAVRDGRHGLPLLRSRREHRPAPRAGRASAPGRRAPRRERRDGGPLRHDGRPAPGHRRV